MFSSSSRLTFTRTAHARVGLRIDGRELDVFVFEVRVVHLKLVFRRPLEDHSAHVSHREAALRERRLAAQDALVRYDAPLLPSLESAEFALRVARDPIEPHLKHWADFYPWRPLPLRHPRGDHVVQLLAVLDAELNTQHRDGEEVHEIVEREARPGENPVLDFLADPPFVESGKSRHLGRAESCGRHKYYLDRIQYDADRAAPQAAVRARAPRPTLFCSFCGGGNVASLVEPEAGSIVAVDHNERAGLLEAVESKPECGSSSAAKMQATAMPSRRSCRVARPTPKPSPSRLSNLDWYGPYVNPAVNSAYIALDSATLANMADASRVIRAARSSTPPIWRLRSNFGAPSYRSTFIGFRCARTP